MIVHDPGVELVEFAGGRAPLGALHRSGVRSVVPSHVRVAGDPLDSPVDGAGLQEGAEPCDEGCVRFFDFNITMRDYSSY